MEATHEFDLIEKCEIWESNRIIPKSRQGRSHSTFSPKMYSYCNLEEGNESHNSAFLIQGVFRKKNNRPQLISSSAFNKKEKKAIEGNNFDNKISDLEHIPLFYLRISDFLVTIDKRIDYIRSLLENLPNNWISGDSQKPSEKVIDLSINFLEKFKFFIQLTRIPIPKILMSPIPDGGFGFNFSIDDDNKLFLRLLNEGIVELDIEKNGRYECLEYSLEEDFTEKVNNAFLNLH
jgi:hypothetical protein